MKGVGLFMELFTVTLPSKLQSTAAGLAALMAQYTNEDLHIEAAPQSQLVQFDLESEGTIMCQSATPYFQLNEHGEILYHRAAKALAEYVVTNLESEMLISIIKKKYQGGHSADVSVIEKYCCQLMQDTDLDGLNAKFLDADRRRRKLKVAEEIELYLNENTRLDLGGIATFRLHGYRHELGDIVEYALDEYVLDKQYQEFISLLKYFVGLQQSKVAMVHLVHRGNHDFMLYNDKFQLFEPKPHSDRLVAEMLETEMNIEDMVISSLIAASPKQIVVHTQHVDMQVIRTIETIFDNRVSVCSDCMLCSHAMGEWNDG